MSDDTQRMAHDDAEDFDAVVVERDRLKAALEVLTNSVERDRREPDKILCHVLTARRALLADPEAPSCPGCGVRPGLQHWDNCRASGIEGFGQPIYHPKGGPDV